MAGDLLRETERACIIALKGNAPLAALVASYSIDPQADTDGVDAEGNAIWPFIRMDGTQSLPQGRGCTARAEVTLQLHSFAKPRYDGANRMVMTARDHAGAINTAVVEAIHGHAFVTAGRRYRFLVRASRLLPDGAEADAWHGIASLVARAYNG